MFVVSFMIRLVLVRIFIEFTVFFFSCQGRAVDVADSHNFKTFAFPLYESYNHVRWSRHDVITFQQGYHRLNCRRRDFNTLQVGCRFLNCRAASCKRIKFLQENSRQTAAILVSAAPYVSLT